MCPNTPVSRSQLALPGYILFLTFHLDAASSYTSSIHGVAIIISVILNALEIDFSNCQFPDCVYVSLRWQLNDPFFIGCLCWSPSSSLQLSTNSLCDLLRQQSVCGDFNYPSIDWSMGSAVSSSSQPIHTLNNLFLYQHITGPTYQLDIRLQLVVLIIFCNWILLYLMKKAWFRIFPSTLDWGLVIIAVSHLLCLVLLYISLTLIMQTMMV